jgi:hypothetical protein
MDASDYWPMTGYPETGLWLVKIMWFRLNPVTQKFPRRTCDLTSSA